MMLIGDEQELSPEVKKLMKAPNSSKNSDGLKAIDEGVKKTDSNRQKAMEALMTQMKDIVRNYEMMNQGQYPNAEGDEYMADASNTADKQAGDVGMFGENMKVSSDEMENAVPGKTEKLTGAAKNAEEADSEMQTDKETGEDTKELRKKLLVASLRTKVKSNM